MSNAYIISDDANVTGNLLMTAGHIELSDISAPSNPGAGVGSLYKKTGDNGLMWKPDASGPERDVTRGYFSVSTAPASTSNNAYVTWATLIYPGSTDCGTIIRVQFVTTESGTATTDVRLQDITNAQTLFSTTTATSATHHLTTITSISNVPTSAACLEFQFRRSGGGGLSTIYSALITM